MATLPNSPWLRQMTEDFTRELEIPLRRTPDDTRNQMAANITQTLEFWRDSRLPEDRFAALMQEARRRTQQAKGKHRAPGLSRPMAYFYTVLADLVRSADGPAGAPSPSTEPPVSISPAGRSAAPRRVSQSNAAPPPGPPYSPYIAGVILEYVRELGAGMQGPAHVTQALHLWQASGLGETPFVAVLHEARQQVRGVGPPRGSLVNVMPQFFAILKELLARSASATTSEGGT